MSIPFEYLGDLNFNGMWKGNNLLNLWYGAPINIRERIKIDQVLKNRDIKERFYSLEYLHNKYPNQPIILLNLASTYASLLNFTDCLNLLNKLVELCTPFCIIDDKLIQWKILIEKECSENIKSTNEEYYEVCERKLYFNDPPKLTDIVNFYSQLNKIQYIQSVWISNEFTKRYRKAFLHLAAIDANETENIFSITPETTNDIIKSGLYYDDLIKVDSRSQIKNSEEVVKILDNTLCAFDICESTSLQPLTSELIMKVHKELVANTKVTKHSYDSNFTFYALTEVDRWRNCNMYVMTKDKKHKYFSNVFDIQPFIEKLLEEYTNSNINPDFLRSDPLKAYIIAAWLHHSLSIIHPFSNENGKIARLISSIPLMKANLPPISIRKNCRSKYIKALETAQLSNDITSLIEIFVNCTMISIEEITEIINTEELRNIVGTQHENNKIKLRACI
ncbi:hypothetical protein HK099_006986 [Clydaea vesicula]|uniref:Fido domain-containing protein n=1 Tax=Clydaea vesicula TaxID=447962 RepID=A0AAD5TXH2_9FUNG|nr:hypothetical protein HK099_006986 [Clydaea vesicula]